MNREVTIIMPVSRPDNLDAIFARLEMLKCKREKTNLLVIVDGPVDLFVKARNFVEMSKFKERLCIQFQSKHKLRQFDIMGRRMRIADIHNELKKHIVDCEFIFGIEDDTIINTNTLDILLKDYGMYPYAGLIQGVQLGRWGIPYVGAWKADDVYEPTEMKSLNPMRMGDVSTLGKSLIQEIDAGGFYCFITRKDNYVKHTFKPFDTNGMGPDVDYGITLRQQGLVNYIDWRITTVHKTKKGEISLLNTEPRVTTLRKKDNRWRQIQV